MSEQNKAVVRRAIDSWNTKPGAAAMARDIYHPDCTINIGVALKGLAGAEEYINIYTTAFPDMKVTAEDLIAEGDKVVCRWRSRGTHRGPLQGIAASGKSVDVSGTMICRLSGGKIIEETNVWDNLLLMQQIGAVGPIGQARTAAR